jgi:hypothetical protein
VNQIGSALAAVAAALRFDPTLEFFFCYELSRRELSDFVVQFAPLLSLVASFPDRQSDGAPESVIDISDVVLKLEHLG